MVNGHAGAILKRARVRELTVALAVCGVVAMSSFSVAGAVYSYHGSDFSQDYESRHRIRACDKESDSNHVKAGWSIYSSGGETDQTTDTDGNNGVCATTYTGGQILKHHTCERNVFSWDCGNWQST